MTRLFQNLSQKRKRKIERKERLVNFQNKKISSKLFRLKPHYVSIIKSLLVLIFCY